MRTPRLPGVYTLVALEEVDSTNAEARRLAQKGEAETPDGTLVWAKRQAAGRGRRGRTWESPEGNLYCSLVLRPECPVARAAELGFVAALAVYDTIASLAEPGTNANVKWPNDVLIHDRKVAGILLETESGVGDVPEWLILGIGVNVLHFPEGTPYPATSLKAEGMADVDVVAVLETFSRHFVSWATRWLEDGFEPIRAAWVWRVKGIGQPIEVRLESEALKGIFKELDAQGALILDQNGKTRRVTAGDVFFPAPAKGNA